MPTYWEEHCPSGFHAPGLFFDRQTNQSYGIYTHAVAEAPWLQRWIEEVDEDQINMSTIITTVVLIILIPAMLLSAIAAILGAINRAARRALERNGPALPPETIQAARELIERFRRSGKDCEPLSPHGKSNS